MHVRVPANEVADIEAGDIGLTMVLPGVENVVVDADGEQNVRVFKPGY